MHSIQLVRDGISQAQNANRCFRFMHLWNDVSAPYCFKQPSLVGGINFASISLCRSHRFIEKFWRACHLFHKRTAAVNNQPFVLILALRYTSCLHCYERGYRLPLLFGEQRASWIGRKRSKERTSWSLEFLEEFFKMVRTEPRDVHIMIVPFKADTIGNGFAHGATVGRKDIEQ